MANLEMIAGSLESTLAMADEKTIQHAWGITSDRREQLELREQWFWTADFPMYRTEGGTAVLYFAPLEYSLIFANIREAVRQIKATGNYVPTKREEARVVRSSRTGRTLRVVLADLDLREENDERCCFEIDTGDYGALNPAQRAPARAYLRDRGGLLPEHEGAQGRGQDHGDEDLRPQPKCVKVHTRAGAIGRACWLDDFYDGLHFIVLDRDIGNANGFLRAVPLPAEGPHEQHGVPMASALCRGHVARCRLDAGDVRRVLGCDRRPLSADEAVTGAAWGVR